MSARHEGTRKELAPTTCSTSNGVGEIAIIIPLYRALEDTLECLDSLARIRHVNHADIIVVDDQSGDETANEIQRRYPAIRLIRREVNGGFAAAVATGWRAVDAKTEFIAVLNSDTIVDPEWLQRAVAVMHDGKCVGAVAPRVVFNDEPDVIESAGLGYTISGWGYRRGCGRQFGPPFDLAHEVLGPTGCAAVYRRVAVEVSGGLYREDFVCYYEDVELAFRLRASGWTCVYEPSSIVRHKVSASYSGRAAQRTYYISRNIQRVFLIHVQGPMFWWAVWHHLALLALQAAKSILDGHPVSYLKGKFASLAHLRADLKDRRRWKGTASTRRWIDRHWLREAMGRRPTDSDGAPLDSV